MCVGFSFDILKLTVESAPREKPLSTGTFYRHDVPHPQEEKGDSYARRERLVYKQHEVILVVTLTHSHLALLTRSENEENQSCLRAFSHSHLQSTAQSLVAKQVGRERTVALFSTCGTVSRGPLLLSIVCSSSLTQPLNYYQSHKAGETQYEITQN